MSPPAYMCTLRFLWFQTLLVFLSSFHDTIKTPACRGTLCLRDEKTNTQQVNKLALDEHIKRWVVWRCVAFAPSSSSKATGKPLVFSGSQKHEYTKLMPNTCSYKATVQHNNVELALTSHKQLQYKVTKRPCKHFHSSAPFTQILLAIRKLEEGGTNYYFHQTCSF